MRVGCENVFKHQENFLQFFKHFMIQKKNLDMRDVER